MNLTLRGGVTLMEIKQVKANQVLNMAFKMENYSNNWSFTALTLHIRHGNSLAVHMVMMGRQSVYHSAKISQQLSDGEKKLCRHSHHSQDELS